MRPVPHALKGIKPVNNEPWARDEAVYNNSRNSVNRDDVDGGYDFCGEGDDTPQWDASIRPPDGAMQVYPA